MDIRLVIVIYLMICILPAVPSPYRSRSRNKNQTPMYDQKQTGEYNIQLHLKDFEVVALLSDSAFGDIGDYDYNYDYSELTVKPGGQTTSKPLPKPEPSTSTPTFISTTPVSSTTAKHLTTTIKQLTTTAKSTIVTTTSTKPPQTEQTTNLNQNTATEKSTGLSTAATASLLPIKKLENELESNWTIDDLKQTEINAKPVEHLTILDQETNQEEHIPFVVHRKCSNGFTRDKLGRCRRVRRPPQFSFGISRLANLASKLRQGGTNDSQQSNESVSSAEN